MVEFKREIVLGKIEQLMARSLAPREVYEWALGFIVAKGFDQFAAQDPVSAKALQVLLDVNEDHKVSLHELKILEFYRQCLSGQREFVPIAEGDEYPDAPQEILEKWKTHYEAQQKKSLGLKERILHGMRVYVYIFTAYVLLSNFWMLFHLGGPWASKRTMATITYPFFVYGGLLILPMQVLKQGRLFVIIFVLSIMAFAYFWFIVFQQIFLGDFHFFAFLVKLFLGAVPASIVLWLLVYEKYLKDKKEKSQD